MILQWSQNTLNSDLLWTSDNKNDQIKALKLHIALNFGEDLSSPLYERVITGENTKSHTRCISIETIKIALDRSNFFGAFEKNRIKTDGTFYRGDNDTTFEILFPYLTNCLSYIKTHLPNEWEKGESEDGFIAINANIEGLIRIFSDIVDHLICQNAINPKSDTVEYVSEESLYYLDPIIDFYKSLGADARLEFKRSYGTAGKTKLWRILQREIHKVREDFNPEGLDKYWLDEDKRYNEDAFRFIRDIEKHLKSDFANRLEAEYGGKWFRAGVPKAVYDKANQLASDKNYEAASEDEEVTAWDCLNIIDYRKIAIYGRNWRDIFEKVYTMPTAEKRGNKEDKTKWMQKLEKIRNNNFHSYSVKEEEYNFLSELHEWLISKV